MRYREIPPAPSLAGHVRFYWFLDGVPGGSEPLQVERILPDGSPELVVHLGDPYARVDGDAERRQPHALVVGQLRGPLLLRPSSRTSIAAVRFEPAGLSAFLGVPAHELQDGEAPADAAWGARGAALHERLAGARSDGARARVLDAFLASCARGLRGPDPRVVACIRAMRSCGGTERVERTAARHGLGLRQAERLFLRDAGLSPKRLARIFRLQSALALLRRADLSLSDVALAAGLCDQPHLDREMRELAGVPPGALRAEPPALAGTIGSA